MPVTGFLVGDDRYELDVPPGFALEEIRATITYGGVWRHLVYRADAREDPANRPYLVHVRDAVTPNAVRVSLYEQREPPPVRLLVWRPGSGVVVTAFNDGEYEQIDRFIDGVAVTPGDPPSVSYGGFFQPGDSRESSQRDEISYRSGDGAAEEVIVLTRLAPGRRAEAAPPTARGWTLQTAGSAAGVMVSWGGPAQRADDIRAGIAALGRSLRRVA